jgi:hypothetical protein
MRERVSHPYRTRQSRRFVDSTHVGNAFLPPEGLRLAGSDNGDP